MSGKSKSIKRFYPNYVDSYEVSDGDSFKLTLDMGHGCFVKVNTRMFGYDTPEKATTAGKMVKRLVEKWCEEFLENEEYSLYWVSQQKPDKFGRSLGCMLGVTKITSDRYSLPIPVASLNDFLIINKLAKPYSGQGRRSWTQQELSLIQTTCERLLIIPRLL